MTIKADIKKHGKHYTPVDLASFLADRIIEAMPQRSRLVVLDPACGDGELLFALHRRVRAQVPEASVELVGYDLDSAAVRFAADRADALGIRVELNVGDFLASARSIPPHTFDVIITNPPYVRTQQLGQDAAQRLATEFGLSGRVDLTHPFVSIAPSMLREGGVIGLLCSNRFLTTRAGANVRRVLRDRLVLRELYDLGDTKLFSAAVLPAIVIGQHSPSEPRSTCRFVSAYELSDGAPTSDVDLYSALTQQSDSVVVHQGRSIAVRAGRLAVPDSLADPWRLSHDDGDEWLRRVEKATWKTFGEVAKIRVGIKTTADSVFISDHWDELSADRPEDDLLLPLVTHENVTPWHVSDELSAKVLYPYDLSRTKRTLVNMDDYPAATRYLLHHEERLRGRKYVTDGGRQWFEIWVPHQPALWAEPKIVFPDISVDPRFAYDTSGAVVNGDCYWISLTDIKDERLALLMLAVANSRLGTRYYDEVCGNKLYSGRRRWMTQYVSRLPIPDPSGQPAAAVVDATKELLATAAFDAMSLANLDTLVEEAFLNAIVADDDHDMMTTLF